MSPNVRTTQRRLRLTSFVLLAVVSGGVISGNHPAAATSAPASVGSPWLNRRILNIAHAGGDLEAPHSTLFAMKSAVAAGADVIDLDTTLSSDGVLMIQHDDTVDRTTEATGPVANYTAAQLQALDNAYWFVPNCWSCHGLPDTAYALRGMRTGAVPPPPGFVPDDFAIPTLARVRSAFPDRILNIEIKTGPNPFEAADAMAAFIATHGPADGYVIVSFDDAIMSYFHSIAPNVPTSPGLNETIDWFVNRGPMPSHQILQVPPTYNGITVVTQQFVADAHANGLAVWVWFNGESDDVASEWQALIDFGVDGLDTGKPSAAQTVIDSNSASFTVQPTIGSLTTSQHGSATVTYSCDPVHVADCGSLLVVVARNKQGHWERVAQAPSFVARGTSTNVVLTLTTFAKRALRSGALTTLVLEFPMNTDTAPNVQQLTIQPL